MADRMGEYVQIVLISKSTGKTRSLNIMPRHWWIAGVMLVTALFFSSAFFSWVSVQLRLPLLQQLMLQTQMQAYRESQTVIHNNLQLMATRLGELQAQLTELNGTGERLYGMLNPGQARKRSEEANKVSAGQGGPWRDFVPTEKNLKEEIERLGKQVDESRENIVLLESSIVEQRVLQRFLPTVRPVANYALGSAFGFRLDPISGLRAMHEGLDMVASVGTPVVAAAAGVVVGANWHPEYGQLLVVDHGMDLVTRYAHLSRMSVSVGQLVRQGQIIGAVGNTGRSTGPHLHFEVRSQGVVLNPATFLEQKTNLAQRLLHRRSN